MKKKYSQSIAKILQSPNLRGKHIILMAGEVFTASTAKGAHRLFDRLTKKFPGKIPSITYIPKEDALILWLS